MTADKALTGILHSVQSSKLNFNVSLTPYSAYITIRRSFIKNFASHGALQTDSNIHDDLKLENVQLKKDVNHLLGQVNNLNVEAKTAKDTINILEDKVSKSEAAALKVFKERILETDKALEYHELEMSEMLETNFRKPQIMKIT